MEKSEKIFAKSGDSCIVLVDGVVNATYTNNVGNVLQRKVKNDFGQFVDGRVEQSGCKCKEGIRVPGKAENRV